MSESKSIFAIFGAPDGQTIDKLMAEKYPKETDSRQLSSGQWLISTAESTPSSVYEHLTDGNDSLYCIVVPVSNYYGWHDAAIWEWIEANGK